MGDGSNIVYWVILGGLCAGFAWLLYKGWHSAGQDNDLWRGWVRRRPKGQLPDDPSLPSDEPPDRS